MASKPKLIVRLTHSEWRAQAWDFFQQGKLISRLDLRYRVSLVDLGDSSDLVTLDPNVQDDGEAIGVRW